MPAAAVIPAPIAYINVAAVKKLVAGTHYGVLRFATAGTVLSGKSSFRLARLLVKLGRPGESALDWVFSSDGAFTLKKLECLKQVLDT